MINNKDNIHPSTCHEGTIEGVEEKYSSTS
jgi:hypothetical protein